MGFELLECVFVYCLSRVVAWVVGAGDVLGRGALYGFRLSVWWVFVGLLCLLGFVL